jgi:energy-coupling factor transport system substrate-specific component
LLSPKDQEDSMQKRSSLRTDFSTRVIVLIPVAIAINIAIGQIVLLLKLPIFLDSIGTVLVAIVAGPWAGALTGLLANLIWGGLTSPESTFYAPVALLIGLSAGILAKYGFFRTWWKVVISGVIIAVIAAVASAPITIGVSGGVSASGITFVVAYMEATGKNLLESVLGASLLFEPLDKVITCLVAWTIVKSLSARYISRFPRAYNILPPEREEREEPEAKVTESSN